MPLNALAFPTIDPTPLFERFRSNYGTEILTVAIAQFKIFDRLASQPKTLPALQQELGLTDRPMKVLITALRAMGLITLNSKKQLTLSATAQEHLVSGGAFDVSGYVALAANNPGVKELAERLTTNRPMGATPQDDATPWIFKPGAESAMDQSATARHFTLALAGRAKNVAPYLAANVPLGSAKLLVDAGGGTGIYSIACLQQNPNLKAIVWDRPEVLKIAAEMAEAYGVADRLECRAGDMFNDPVPAGADVILLSNILHDWDEPECEQLIIKLAAGLPSGGRLLIHDALLNDELDGPLPIALYSTALYCVTEGRAYSAAEYRRWTAAAGLIDGDIYPTLVHCSVLSATKKK